MGRNINGEESLRNGKTTLSSEDEPNVLTTPEEETQEVLPNRQIKWTAFDKPTVDMKEWL